MSRTKITLICAALALVLLIGAVWQPASAAYLLTATPTPYHTATLRETFTATPLVTFTPTAWITETPTPVVDSGDPNSRDLTVSTLVVTGSISVTGNAEVLVTPDEVVLTVGVETNDLVLTTAKKANDEIISRVLEITESYQIDPKYVQTDYINIEPRYSDSYGRKESFIGYFVRKNIVIRLKDISQFEQFYSEILEAGVTHVHSIEFRTTELRKYRDQARDMAIKAAREKAVALSGSLDQAIGSVKSIREDSGGWRSSYSSWWGYGGGGMAQNVIQNAGPASAFVEEGTLAPGQISVTASVTVEFELLK